MRSSWINNRYIYVAAENPRNLINSLMNFKFHCNVIAAIVNLVPENTRKAQTKNHRLNNWSFAAPIGSKELRDFRPKMKVLRTPSIYAL